MGWRSSSTQHAGVIETSMTESVYEESSSCFGPGENLFNLETGEVTRHLPEERPNSFKGARRILSLPDSAIELMSVRSNGVEWYRIEEGTVKWKPKTKTFFCGKPGCGVRGDCPHSRRVARWRKEHPVESAA